MHPNLGFQWWPRAQQFFDSGPKALPLLLPPTELSLEVMTLETWKRLMPLAACAADLSSTEAGPFPSSLLLQLRLVPCTLLNHLRRLESRHFLGNCMDQCGTFCRSSSWTISCSRNEWSCCIGTGCWMHCYCHGVRGGNGKGAGNDDGTAEQVLVHWRSIWALEPRQMVLML